MAMSCALASQWELAHRKLAGSWEESCYSQINSHAYARNLNARNFLYVYRLMMTYTAVAILSKKGQDQTTE
eukprot:scaffold13215_cov61-Cyclotella_meneghiniana.AAC.1